MKRRERLLATVRGQAVDRPPVCFYELNGLDEHFDDPDPYNIYNHLSWKPLIDLTQARTDRIVMRNVPYYPIAPDPLQEITSVDTWIDAAGRRFTRTTIQTAKRTLSSLTRRDRDINTLWTVEPLLKDVKDLRAYLELPMPELSGTPDIQGVLDAEAALGDSGIVMIDTSDPLCEAAQLFEMATYLVIAFTDQALFHRLLERFATQFQAKTQAVAQALPGRLWRIYGPEYASPPYLPPRLFREYVGVYETPLIETIHRYGGYARIHCHGRINDILDDIVATGCIGLDPIEPPPQGDVSLRYVRENYGERLVLFGNLEASDIEILPTPLFCKKVRQSLQEGTAGQGRGFVLMPSACPYGRNLSPLALANYQGMIETVEDYYGVE